MMWRYEGEFYEDSPQGRTRMCYEILGDNDLQYEFDVWLDETYCAHDITWMMTDNRGVMVSTDEVISQLLWEFAEDLADDLDFIEEYATEVGDDDDDEEGEE